MVAGLSRPPRTTSPEHAVKHGASEVWEVAIAISKGTVQGTGSPPIGRREANKRDKLLRIRRAARDVFLRKGFEAATVREIATEADVAFGTLFLYADSKRDLLLLLFDEELPVVSERAHASALSHDDFVNGFIAFFAEFYAFFRPTPSLSRDMLRENTFSSGGMVSARIWESVQVTERLVADLVEAAKRKGQIDPGINTALVSHMLFSLYRIELRFCMDQAEPDVPASLANLRMQIETLVGGLAPGGTTTSSYRRTADRPRKRA